MAGNKIILGWFMYNYMIVLIDIILIILILIFSARIPFKPMKCNLVVMPEITTMLAVTRMYIRKHFPLSIDHVLLYSFIKSNSIYCVYFGR